MQSVLSAKDWKDQAWIQPETLILESGIPREHMLPNPVGHFYWEDGGERHTCHGVGGPALWPKWSEETKSFADTYVHDRRGPPGPLRKLQKDEVWALQGRHLNDFKVLADKYGVDRMIDDGCRATGGQTAANLLAGAGALISKAIEQEVGKAGASPDQVGAEALAQILLWLRRWRRGDFGRPIDHRKAGGEEERGRVFRWVEAWWIGMLEPEESDEEDDRKAGGRRKTPQEAAGQIAKKVVDNIGLQIRPLSGEVGERVEEWLERRQERRDREGLRRSMGKVVRLGEETRVAFTEYLSKTEDAVGRESKLLAYVGYLGWLGCSVNTIRQAIFAIKTAHKRIGHGDITEGMHRIWILLGGRNTARKPRRLGVTQEMMVRLGMHLVEPFGEQTHNPSYDGRSHGVRCHLHGMVLHAQGQGVHWR